ncbi:hypothetical protein H5410_038802 [Solanum commersonii]|uniref:Uncharacterized protein n=1 Tax=Solanum commersonii TaxID=4109 RepID=A0A9J5YBN3_SOLCO|nr:hypothetical protein H5410_038802 [Solanum commersonii]
MYHFEPTSKHKGPEFSFSLNFKKKQRISLNRIPPTGSKQPKSPFNCKKTASPNVEEKYKIETRKKKGS